MIKRKMRTIRRDKSKIETHHIALRLRADTDRCYEAAVVEESEIQRTLRVRLHALEEK